MCCSWHPKSSGRLLHDWLVFMLPFGAAQQFPALFLLGACRERRAKGKLDAVIGNCLLQLTTSRLIQAL